MGEHENLEVVRDTYLAYRDLDIPALLNCLTDDVMWFSIGPPEIIPTAGTWYGRGQVEHYFATLQGTEEVQSFNPEEFIVEGDKVVAMGHLQHNVRSTGSLIESPWIHVFTLRDGKISEFRAFYDTAVAVAALADIQSRSGNMGTAKALMSTNL
jgi:ketosteroid isomerase-like protein